jgi:membrane protein implicated in regulation of membrane protease activity
MSGTLIGTSGVVIVPTRGSLGAGEVLLTIRGGTESYLAWSRDPLAKGEKVLVVDVRGARTVDVEAIADLTS